MRDGFSEMVEEYIRMFQDEYSGDELADVVVDEMSATYKLDKEDIAYIRMEAKYA